MSSNTKSFLVLLLILVATFIILAMATDLFNSIKLH